ncbi:MAG TPA: adenine phosphoribosyltransferase, partial [Dehalococcoidia bacterium]|nr:adenine phosphoribosyltransferase [Dehalococcoidia bacterium]
MDKTASLERDLKRLIRDVPDFPQPGVLFRDITPLLQDAAAFKQAVDWL